MTSPTTPKPPIIGLYGLSGAGKSYLLNKVKNTQSTMPHQASPLPTPMFYDGSSALDAVVPGGLTAFKALSPAEQDAARGHAITYIGAQCATNNTTGVVAGHYMLWDDVDDGQEKPVTVGVEADWDVYTHIAYLRVDAGDVVKRREDDKVKQRPKLSREQLDQWQKSEIAGLRAECEEKGIWFTIIEDGASAVERLGDLVTHPNSYRNRVAAEEVLRGVMDKADFLDTFMVFDADRTLAAEDTGALFWEEMNKMASKTATDPDPLKKLFKTHGYSYDSFRRATLLYEEQAVHFAGVCAKVAEKVTLYPQILTLLHRASSKPHIKIVILTCGIRHIWTQILARSHLPHIPVLGGSRVSDGYVMTGKLKGELVSLLHTQNFRVVAFGDSPLDMAMLREADQAHIIVGNETSRSKTMDADLSIAIAAGLPATQILLPSTSTPRLDEHILPILELGDTQIENLVKRPSFTHATHKPITKILQTALRDAAQTGPTLRAAHEEVGKYLALEYVTGILGTETYGIRHVQKKMTDGYRLRDEEKTLIVPLMRGGEPMAFGVSKAFNTAMFAHAKTPDDLDRALVARCRAIVLVDSVVNSGKSVVEFVDALRGAESVFEGRIVVVTGVVQEGAVRRGALAELLRTDGEVFLVALRVSENEYKGRGGTDTGHRLFNTTMLD
ncbi:hypothetical protein P280DRAFT_260566 [Massarina eburnea CBS 473.64]|uniref:Phosphoribosyltransferase domain-containing protein n=1 Tax=Massarina eburnea CBS 473.64 TaxID=1395130 RepID=A0A6A6RGY9_9PLEO|nr:hypothetical protein P280DRAFT_260566 [Massarina eburnea CBS 473.64]